MGSVERDGDRPYNFDMDNVHLPILPLHGIIAFAGIQVPS